MSSFLVDRTVTIRARRSTVFRYFTDTERFAAWWGEGSTIDPKPGGRVHIRYPNGATAGGEIVEIVPNERVVFTFGYDDPTKPIPRGGSRVVVTFEGERETLVRLVHHVDSAKVRDEHAPGWRFQLSLFANVACCALDEAVIDRWFDAWNGKGELDVPDDVVFRDRYAAIESKADLVQHIAATKIHMPGITLEREGSIRFCQGVALVNWTAGPMKGTNVFELDVDGRIARVTGIAQ